MAAAHHAVAQLASYGAQVLVEDEVLAAFASGSVTSLNAPDARADVILSLGGDGTLLRGAQYALSWDAALLGVNLGRVGFLAEGEADALPKLLDKVIRGDYETERRAVLSVQMNGQSWYAINDVVMSRGGYARLITVTALVDGALAGHYIADGLVVATPTGSTGYSLSAGGPVVEPTARNLIVSPICAHSVHANSYVLSPERTVTVQTEKTGYKPIFLSADGGRAFSLRNGDAVEIRRSKYETKLVRLSNKSFCDILQKKMLMGVLGHE